MPNFITSHDVLEPLEQALLASRDVIISGQICGSKLQSVFTLGDGCWLPTLACRNVRASFWQNGFFADFYFWAAGFDLVAGFFLLVFVGKVPRKKSSRKIPGKILQNSYNKNPRQLSAEGPGQEMVFGPLLSHGRLRVGAFYKRQRVEKRCLLNIVVYSGMRELSVPL